MIIVRIKCEEVEEKKMQKRYSMMEKRYYECSYITCS